MNKSKWLIMFRYFWPAYLWVLILLLLTGLPGNDFPSIPSFWNSLYPDKIVHMGLFGMLILLLAAGSYYKAGKVALSKKLVVTYLVVTITLGGVTELLQKWVFVGRSCDIKDFYADTVGVIFALLLYFVIFENGKQKIN